MQIYIVLGPPRSGLNVLANCLQLIGFTQLENNTTPGPSSINQILLQDLGLTSKTSVLPLGWEHAEAASMARERINRFLSTMSSPVHNACNTVQHDGQCFLVIQNALTLSLWQQVLRDKGYDPGYIFILRHPWEVAQSLSAWENINPGQGHILWLSYISAALRAIEGMSAQSRVCESDPDPSHPASRMPLSVLITYDQLLADPVTTLSKVLDSSLPPSHSPHSASRFPHSATSDLLDYVDPGLKHHHASDLSRQDQETFQHFAMIYDELRLVKRLNDKDHGITYSLLQALSQNESLSPDIAAALSLLASSLLHDPSRPALSASVYIPTQNGTVHTETIALQEDQWQKISLPVPDTSALRDRQIKLNPLKTPGTVSIASIALISRATGEELWSANDGKDFDILEIRGTALRVPDPNNLTYLVTGTKAEIILPGLLDVQDIPVDLMVGIKPVICQGGILERYNVHWTPKPCKPAKRSNRQDPVIFELEVILPDNKSILIPFATDKQEYIKCENKVINFSIPDSEHLYLYSSNDSNFSATPHIDYFSLHPDTEYTFSGHFESMGSVMVWAIEYDKYKRINHQPSRVENDFFEMHFQTDTSHHTLCVALRLSGDGHLNLREHSLKLKRIHQDTLSATLKKQVDELKVLKESLEKKVAQNCLNAAKQLEAHLAIQHYLQTGQNIKEMHGWAVSPDLARYLIDILESSRYDLVVEFGSGISTALMARVIANISSSPSSANPKFIAFEHLEKYHHKTYEMLKDLHLQDNVDLILAPLTSNVVSGQKEYPFYNCDDYLKTISNQYDSSIKIFVFVDGPPASTGKHARYPALPVILNYFSGFQIDILLDDYIRDDEKEIVRMWQKELNENNISYVVDIKNFEKEAFLLSIQGNNIT